MVASSSGNVAVKICGIDTTAAIKAAADGGARYLGFVFFARSPRHLTLDAAATLAAAVPIGIAKVALSVNADDATLDEIVDKVPLDMLQLHGAETPDRVAEVRARYGLPVMKAIGIANEADLPAIADYAQVADQILVDAKPPKNGALPGGNGITFDWRLVQGRRWAVPWMLSGGLTPDNVAEAIRLTGANQLDLSSGVESAPGVKDPGLIQQFLHNAGI